MVEGMERHGHSAAIEVAVLLVASLLPYEYKPITKKRADKFPGA